MNYIKVFVAVTVAVDETGTIKPLTVIFGGREYTVNKVVDVRRTPPEHVGGIITHRFDCKIGNAVRSLYRDADGRWFVETPALTND